MKNKMNINKKSWHYRLALYGCNFSKYELNYVNDFCGYLRELVWGIFMCLALVAILSFILGTIFGSWIFYLVASIQLGFFPEFLELMWLLPVFVLSIGLVFLTEYLKELMRERERNATFVTVDLSERGFFSMLFSKFKNKVCYSIEFKD